MFVVCVVSPFVQMHKSRFYGSDSESEEDEDDYTTEDEEGERQATKVNRFVQSSDDEEEEVRVVRSAKEKRFEELEGTIKSLKNQMKINDWTSISNSFDVLLKQVQKAEAITKKEGYPRFYLRIVVALESLLVKQAADKEGLSSMSKLNAKAFNSMKQKLRKYTKTIEKQIEAYSKTAKGTYGTSGGTGTAT